MWGKDIGAAKLLREQPDSDAAKTIEKVQKEMQTLKAELKAAKEGKPMPSSEEPGTATTKDEAAEDDFKENLDKAKLSLKGVQEMSESAKALFGMELYNEKLAQAKLQVDNATKAKFKGQPIDAQLRGAKTRMEHTKQALEHKKSVQQKAQLAMDDAQKRVQAADQAVADMAAKLETQKLELSQLQHQSAQELAGNDEFQNPPLSSQITKVLQDLLKLVPKDQAKEVCEKGGLNADRFEEQFLGPYLAAARGEKTNKDKDPEPNKEAIATIPTIEIDKLENAQEMDWDDLADFESFDNTDDDAFATSLESLISVGFKQPAQGEERQTTTKNIAEWAKKRKLEKEVEAKKMQTAFKVIKASKQAKTTVAK